MEADGRRHSGNGGVASRRVRARMQRCHERYQRLHFRGVQVLAISGHVTAALDDLPDQLISGEPRGDVIERGSPLSAVAAQGVAIAALLGLEYGRAAQFNRRSSFDERHRNRIAGPRIHMR